MHSPQQIAFVLNEDSQLLQLVDAAFADSARRSGEHLVCHPGCTQCCHGAFAISPLDAFRLRAGISQLQQQNPALAQSIEQRAHAYIDTFSATFPGDPATGILGASDEDQEAFDDFANEAACPALNPESGLCDIYFARPMTCRVFGPPIRAAEESAETGQAAFAVCELCFTQASPEEIAASELHIPHAEEQRLDTLLQNANSEDQPASEPNETIVAYCLIPAHKP
ncbi:YkgJ family cysteine cluster protein [Acidicapsa ligni]|uniref:YkgJ family cysteine cluster protein n=1 Tax=Acidicapsa ligni TaxID=542300 RepID=UPI0021DF8EE8|nr:YkgJ family cysteine cluster protein [Acidicapsa ligni]